MSAENTRLDEALRLLVDASRYNRAEAQYELNVETYRAIEDALRTGRQENAALRENNQAVGAALRELANEMHAKAAKIRAGDYGNERAIATLIDGWVQALAAGAPEEQ